MKRGRIIAIDGVMGSGKTFLTKQLSALTRMPAILEGEMGVLPDWIFPVFKNPEKVHDLCTFFTDRYLQGFTNARTAAEAGLDCFLDVGALTQEAYLRYDSRMTGCDLVQFVISLHQAVPDISILLLASEPYLRTAVVKRNRPHESEENIQRALGVQEFYRFPTRNYHPIAIHRDDLDFQQATELKKIWELIENKLTTTTYGATP